MAVLTLIFGFSQVLSAQTVVFGPEDFEGTMDATTEIPTGWQETGLSDDGIWAVGDETVASSQYWTVPAHPSGGVFAYSNDDACNCDKSEDRMILPAQDFSALSGFLTLNADLFHDGSYGNIGSVEVSTDQGTTWTELAVVENLPDWQIAVGFNLSAYVGESSVWVAFRQNDGGGWTAGFCVDNVSILNSVAPEPDASVAPVLGEYTIVPVSQVGSPIATSAVVTNSGNADITNAVVSSTVYDGAMNVLHSETSAPVALIAPAGSETVTLTGYTPTAVDSYMVLHIVSIDEADVASANDSTMYTYVLSDSTYARDNGIADGSLGIGSADGGQLGQSFSVSALDTMTSVSMQISNASGDMTGLPISATIYDTDPVTGAPVNVLATTETVLVDATPDQLYTCVITNGLELAPGTYAVVANETGTNITLATSTSIFTAGATWVIFDTNPWANSEDYGFDVAYLLRPNFGSVVESTVGLSENSSANVSIYPNPSTGNFNLNMSGLTASTVDVNITDVSGKVVMNTSFNTVNGGLNAPINISNVEEGVYIVRVNGDSSIVKRIVVSKK
jgi:hypothetical protein